MVFTIFKGPQVNVCHCQIYENVSDIYIPLHVMYVSLYVFMRHYARKWLVLLEGRQVVMFYWDPKFCFLIMKF